MSETDLPSDFPCPDVKAWALPQRTPADWEGEDPPLRQLIVVM